MVRDLAQCELAEEPMYPRAPIGQGSPVVARGPAPQANGVAPAGLYYEQQHSLRAHGSSLM